MNDLLQRSVPNFSGFFYRHTNIEQAYDLLKDGVNLIIATDTILPGILTLGFEAIASVALNVFPENTVEIYDLMLNGKIREARDANDKLQRRIKDISHNHLTDPIEVMKLELNKKVDWKLGELRRPRLTWSANRKW